MIAGTLFFLFAIPDALRQLFYNTEVRQCIGLLAAAALNAQPYEQPLGNAPLASFQTSVLPVHSGEHVVAERQDGLSHLQLQQVMFPSRQDGTKSKMI